MGPGWIDSKAWAGTLKDYSMKEESHSICELFSEDHRHMTRGFAQLLSALDRNDLKAAVNLAQEIDQAAGPHIEFEERILYPAIAKRRGKDYAAGLYDEHQVARRAILTLLEHEGRSELEPGEKRRLLTQVQTALDHAVSCGTLVSFLEHLNPEEESLMLEQMATLRRQNHRWTELAGA
jgi:hemerythrin-like domain-containing protein